MELTNKIVAFLGDSITEGHGTSSHKRRYSSLLQQTYNLKESLNYGIGGTRIAHQHRASEKPRWDLCFCGRAYNIDPRAELIVVFGGVNDYIHGDAPFGTPGDSTPDTFCGGVDFLMTLLREKYPKSRLAFVTPARCEGRLEPSRHPYKQADAKPLADYVQVILETGAKHGIPVLDLYHTFPIDANDPEDKARYAPDGVHFNDEGQALLAKHLAAFLESI